MYDRYSTTTLTLQAILSLLARHIEEMIYWQLWDEQDPDHGAIYNADYGTADNKATSAFITVCTYTMIGNQKLDPSTICCAPSAPAATSTCSR
jgi:hypothetical protein